MYFIKRGLYTNYRGRGSRPVSRVLSESPLEWKFWIVIHLGHSSPNASSNLPGSICGPQIANQSHASLFGLAPDGVYPATAVTSSAAKRVGGRYIFCGTFHRLSPPRRYLASRPAEPGLSSPAICGSSDYPADSRGLN